MNEKEKLKSLSDLEGDVSDLLMIASILNELVETDTSRVFRETQNGESYAQVYIGRAEAERLNWMAGECMDRARQLHGKYIAAIEA
ncbi:hypothetical protein [Pelagibacterium sediminicola]|uniref:hypothetical protein n=1 Tax=Pelagibacterium sediminicola TaxID=2248761 RepID=UPI000E316F24|nr:hypothetical protein [Pelagibacterium sediminicola]